MYAAGTEETENNPGDFVDPLGAMGRQRRPIERKRKKKMHQYSKADVKIEIVNIV